MHRRLAKGGTGDDQPVNRLDAPAAGDELAGEPVEQLRVGGQIAHRAEIAGRGDEPAAEVAAPDPVDHHPGRQGMIRGDQPVGQHRPPAGRMGQRRGTCRRGVVPAGEEGRRKSRHDLGPVGAIRRPGAARALPAQLGPASSTPCALPGPLPARVPDNRPGTAPPRRTPRERRNRSGGSGRTCDRGTAHADRQAQKDQPRRLGDVIQGILPPRPLVVQVDHVGIAAIEPGRDERVRIGGPHLVPRQLPADEAIIRHVAVECPHDPVAIPPGVRAAFDRTRSRRSRRTAPGPASAAPSALPGPGSPASDRRAARRPRATGPRQMPPLRLEPAAARSRQSRPAG